MLDWMRTADFSLVNSRLVFQPRKKLCKVQEKKRKEKTTDEPKHRSPDADWGRGEGEGEVRYPIVPG